METSTMAACVLLPALVWTVATAQIYLPCEDSTIVTQEGCSCWNQQAPIITCSSLGLTRIPEITKAFSVNLSNNNLSYILEGSLDHLIDMTRLILNHNNIYSVRYRSLDKTKSLEYIDMDHNELNSVPSLFSREPTSRNPLANLTVLRLSYNSIWSVRGFAFRRLPNLKELYLVGNPIIHIKSDVWKGIGSRLERLEMTAVSRDILMIPTRGIEHIKYLRLKGLRPRSLDRMKPFFNAFTNLQHLGLESMNLQDGHFKKGNFPSAWNTTLIGLSLSDNELTAIPDNVNTFDLLQDLDVSHNWIKRVHGSKAQIPQQLTKFNISNNMLVHLSSRQFLSLQNAREIDISNNMLVTMDLTLDKLQRDLLLDVVLYLSGNEWECHRCHNRWLVDILPFRYITGYDELNTYRCASDGTNKGSLIKDIPVREFCNIVGAFS